MPIRPITRLLPALFLFLALLLPGCASLKPAKPEVALAGLELLEAGLLEQRFLLKLRLTNPGETEIAIHGLRFELELNGEPFARGVSDKAITVPRLGEAQMEVAASSDLSALLRQVRTMAKSGRKALDYRLHGNLSVPIYGSIPFDRRGEVRLPSLSKGD